MPDPDLPSSTVGNLIAIMNIKEAKLKDEIAELRARVTQLERKSNASNQVRK